ncbi:hypothetical protein BDY21DRAFT_368024 [Lineolata rhizophorae]|uniref:Uncharacterized protein n=1 Tax=Lineolata rhizophorae TaxID=578093 RepID=A0A6A6PCZ0_9PEZI|nr:hypothetical protein BDY21DRAFT_368024 [Lineolata rhizophorae]
MAGMDSTPDIDRSIERARKTAESASSHPEDAMETATELASHETEFTNGMYENQGSMENDESLVNPATFKSEGAVGKQFAAEGSIGSMGQEIGGPFDKDGAIGKQFTTGGSVGGSIQEKLTPHDAQGKK